MTKRAAALGIDIGTGSTKAGLVADDGRLLAVGRSPHPIEEPRPGWSETDPARWLDSVAAAVTEVLARMPDHRVEAIGLSGQMHGVVVCDGALSPLRPAVLWSDRRSEPYLGALRRELDRRFDGDASARLANPVVAGMAGPTIAALGPAEPELMAAARTVLQPKDWVRHRLTGVVATDPSDASATLLWDAASDRWSGPACAAFAVDPAWLPEVRPSSVDAGSLTVEGAARLGLDVGIPVAVGAADTAAALLGAGVAIGETQVSVGTGGQIAQPCAQPRTDQTGRTHLFRATTLDPEEPPTWYAMAAVQNVGVAIDWAMSLLEATAAEIGAVMSGRAPGHGPGPASDEVVFLPYLTGERTPHMDATLTGEWRGLRSGTSRSELFRSVHVGVARAMADGLAALQAAGYRVDSALLAGGGSTSNWWRHVLADTLGIPLIPHEVSDASVRGAGLLAWASVGHPLDPADGVQRDSPVEPR